MALTTLARIQAEIKGTEAYKKDGTDQQIMNYLRVITARVQGFFKFEPQYVTRKITPTGLNVDTARGLLSLEANLLEVKSITVGGRAVTYGTDIVSDPDDGQTPIHTLRIVDLCGGPIHSWYPCCTSNWADSIAIAGFWGMRTNYSTQGFFDSGVTCPAMNNSQRTAVVSDVDGPDIYGRLPLFSPGNLIRIEDELCEVAKVDGTTKTLTLMRGMNGTRVVTHDAGKVVQIFEPEEDVVGLVTRQSALMLARRGAYQQIQAGGIVVSYPPDLLPEVYATIQRFNYL